MASVAEVERTLTGLWAIHLSRTTMVGSAGFRWRPVRHIFFSGSHWQRYETGWRWRLKSAGIVQGSWRAVDLGREALVMLTVRSCFPSAASETMLQTNYSYAGGAAIVIGAQVSRENEASKMRNGEARMYFLPVLVRPGEIIMAAPSTGPQALRQRWTYIQPGSPI